MLVWAIVLYPLAFALLLAAFALNRTRGPCTLFQFALGGLASGAVLTFAWLEPQATDVPLLMAAFAGGGGCGAATAVAAWYLGVHERSA